MATRGAIARTDDNQKFIGVRHHWYNAPEQLGRTLWNLFHNHFNRDLKAMTDFLIDEHPAGWSNIVGADFTLPAGYIPAEGGVVGPKCYCHGTLSAGAKVITDENGEDEDVLWTYAFNVAANTMTVFKLKEAINTINLLGDEPVWPHVQCGPMLERCEHTADEHFPDLVGTPSGKMSAVAWVGHRMPDIYDVTAVLVNGSRYTLTGKSRGGNQVFHATVVGPRGKDEQEMVIGRANRKVQGGYQPEGTVVWIFPPTRNVPNETRRGYGVAEPEPRARPIQEIRWEAR